MNIKKTIESYNALTNSFFEIDSMMVEKANEILKKTDFSAFPNVTGNDLNNFVSRENKFKNYHLPFACLGKKIFYHSYPSVLKLPIRDIFASTHSDELYTLIIQSIRTNEIISFDDCLHDPNIRVQKKGYLGKEIEFVRLYGKDDDRDFPKENSVDIHLSFIQLFLDGKIEDLKEEIEVYINNLISWFLLSPLHELQAKKISELQENEISEKEQKKAEEVALLMDLARKHPKLVEELGKSIQSDSSN